MDKFIKIIFFLFLPVSLYSQTAKDVAKKCLSSTVSIVIEDVYRQPLSLGSGFIVEPGKVVTNYHVINGGAGGYVILNGFSEKHKIFGYTVIDKVNDLAILSVPTLSGIPLPLMSKTISEIGEQIYAIGSPQGMIGTISQGIISGIREVDKKHLLQITAPISPGSSGGPVLNNDGQVIGIAVGTLTSGQNLNFAIPTSCLHQILLTQKTPIPLSSQTKYRMPIKIAGNETDIKKGVTIRNISYFEGYEGNTPIKGIESFSFKNNLPYPISKIRVLFIVSDKAGEPLDYEESVFCYSDTIKPYLAKTVYTRNLYSRAYYKRNSDEKIEIRLLDFQIIDE